MRQREKWRNGEMEKPQKKTENNVDVGRAREDRHNESDNIM